MSKLVKVCGLCLVVASASLVGCGSQAVKPQPRNIEDSSKFVVLDESMGDRLELTNSVTKHVGNMAVAMVELKNNHFKTIHFDYRFAWYDSDGFELELESKAWKPKSIPSKGQVTVKTTAPSPAASSFKIFINKSRSAMK